jgi:hypothetical protein
VEKRFQQPDFEFSHSLVTDRSLTGRDLTGSNGSISAGQEFGKLPLRTISWPMPGIDP